jgi:hypothetical protein
MENSKLSEEEYLKKLELNNTSLVRSVTQLQNIIKNKGGSITRLPCVREAFKKANDALSESYEIKHNTGN